MNDEHMVWERLNAYVDGELLPDEAAVIAEGIARDPVLARRVAAISALKAAINDSAPPHPGHLQLHRPGPMRRRVAAMAALLLIAALGGAGWFAELHRDPPGIALAEQSHRQWLAARSQAPTGQAAETFRVGLDSLRLAYVPDLTQVDLIFDGVRRINPRGGRGLHVGYLGPRGCVVSLVVFERAGDRDRPLTPLVAGGRTAWNWTTGGASFFLLAPAMDPARLTSIAKVVQQLTRTRLPLDAEGVLALHEGRSGTTPCLTS